MVPSFIKLIALGMYRRGRKTCAVVPFSYYFYHFPSFSSQRSKYTKMNVWIHYLYWSDSYPTGPDDPKCENFKAASPQQATPDYFNS